MKNQIQKILNVIVCLLLVATVFAVAVPKNVNSEDPEDPGFPEEPELPEEPEFLGDIPEGLFVEWIEGDYWWVEGNGTHFRLTNSPYLNISLISSENVYVYLESIPEVVSFHIEADCDATTTDITLTGFEANKTYYRYQDGDLNEEYTTDENGSYSYMQDISTHHHVFITEIESTIYIEEDGDIVPETASISKDGEIYNLTDNVTESIFIQRPGITLNGNGYSVTGSGSYGIYIQASEGNVLDVEVSGFSTGMYIGSPNNNISGNTITNNRQGLYLGYHTNNVISENNLTGNDYQGIFLLNSGSNKFRNNIIAGSDYNFGISGNHPQHYVQDIDTSNTVNGKPIYYLVGCSHETVPLDAGFVGIVNSDYITVKNITLTNNRCGALLSVATQSIIQNVTFSNNMDGILLYRSNSNTIEECRASNCSVGVGITSSNSNTIVGNIISDIEQRGIYLGGSPNSVLSGNIISNCKQGIELFESSDANMRNNIVSGCKNNFVVKGETLPHFSHDIDTSNTVDTRPIYYWVGEDNKTVPLDAGYVGIVDSENIIVEDLTLTNNYHGVLFAYTSNSIIQNVNASLNEYGIFIWYSHNNLVNNNNISCSQGVRGIYQYSSSMNIINGNLIRSDDLGTGIYSEYSDSNTFTNNTIGGNPMTSLRIDNSNNESIKENTMKYGGYLYRCSNIEITNNNITDKDFYVEGSNNITVIENSHNQSGITLSRSSDCIISGNFGWLGGIGIWNSDDNVISGNTITHSGIEMGGSGGSEGNVLIGNIISNPHPYLANGFIIRRSSYNTFLENNISGHQSSGFYIHDSNNNTFSRNNITDIYVGFGVYYSIDNKISENIISDSTYGLYIMYSNNNSYLGNAVSNSWFSFRILYSPNNVFSRNTITQCYWGFDLGSSSNNTFMENTISDHSHGPGNIYYSFRLTSSTGNLIYHNNIINTTSNPFEAYDTNPEDNDWHHPGLLEGNYWSNYTGLDCGGESYPWDPTGKHLIANDGIGDTLVPHHTTDYDHYPFMDENGWLNKAPIANADGPYVDYEGTEITFNAELSSDPDGDPLQYRWDFNDDGTWDTDWSESPTAPHTWFDDHLGTAKVEVSDGSLTDTAKANVTVLNADPLITSVISPLDPIQINMIVEISAEFTDAGILDTHEAVIDWGDETVEPGDVDQLTGGGTVSGNHTYVTPDVYTVTLTVIDDDGGECSITTEYVVIYDPTGAFVTGGGMIDSPPGAFPADPDLIGKAGFGFVSKYKKGAFVPDGNTQFRFHAADINFQSDSYEWLVVAGPKAMFKGSGTINGEGNYGFLLSAIDGDMPGGHGIDKFRIKIWDKATGEIVYDNGLGAPDDADPASPLTHGSIKIHKA